MDLMTGLIRIVSELKALGTNFMKQNILTSRFGHPLGLLMGFSEPVTCSLALVFVKTFQM